MRRSWPLTVVSLLGMAVFCGCANNAGGNPGSPAIQATDGTGDDSTIESTNGGPSAEVKGSTLSSKIVGRVSNLGNASPDKRDAAETVSDALSSDTELQITHLSVDGTGNVITIRSSVPTEVLNQSAEHLARSCAGPGYIVEDDLSIQTSG